MIYKKIIIELIVLADEADSVVTRDFSYCTVRLNVALCIVDPDVAVTVTG